MYHSDDGEFIWFGEDEDLDNDDEYQRYLHTGIGNINVDEPEDY